MDDLRRPPSRDVDDRFLSEDGKAGRHLREADHHPRADGTTDRRLRLVFRGMTGVNLHGD